MSRHKSALGTGRDDNRILDHLRLDQPQHLGAEVLAPVGPAQAAAGDRAERTQWLIKVAAALGVLGGIAYRMLSAEETVVKPAITGEPAR